MANLIKFCMSLSGFQDALKSHRYKTNTIEQYLTCVKRSNVEYDKKSVKRYLRKNFPNDTTDPNGDVYRAMLAFYRYIREKKLPGGRKNDGSTYMTVRDRCLHIRKRKTIRDFLWLVFEMRYSTSTAYMYATRRHKLELDKHCNVKRAKNSFHFYPEEEYAKGLDSVLAYIYRCNLLRRHYRNLDE